MTCTTLQNHLTANSKSRLLSCSFWRTTLEIPTPASPSYKPSNAQPTTPLVISRNASFGDGNANSFEVDLGQLLGLVKRKLVLEPETCWVPGLQVARHALKENAFHASLCFLGFFTDGLPADSKIDVDHRVLQMVYDVKGPKDATKRASGRALFETSDLGRSVLWRSSQDTRH